MKAQNLIILFLFISISTVEVFSQREKMQIQMKFEVVDAKGNRDTVVYAIRDKATNGIDAELGEVNLFGIPPKGDLDMRLVQRNIKFNPQDDQWLFALYPLYIPAFPENVDLKKDFRNSKYDANNNTNYYIPYTFVIKIFAKHYPIQVNLLNANKINYYNENDNSSFVIVMRTFNETNLREVNDNNEIYFNYWSVRKNNPFSTKIINNDTICEYLENSIRIRNSRDSSYSFNSSAANEFLLGFNYFENGYGDVFEQINSLKVSPNPSNSSIMINDGNLGDKFDICNSVGEIVSTFTATNIPFIFDINNLPNGTYYIINRTSNKDFGKFTKE